jgi:hypothetical protein
MAKKRGDISIPIEIGLFFAAVHVKEEGVK